MSDFTLFPFVHVRLRPTPFPGLSLPASRLMPPSILPPTHPMLPSILPPNAPNAAFHSSILSQNTPTGREDTSRWQHTPTAVLYYFTLVRLEYP